MYPIDRPLRMIAGSIADTFYMTEQCSSRATGTQDIDIEATVEIGRITT